MMFILCMMVLDDTKNNHQQNIETIELTKKYADLPMDFADACLVFLAEKLDIDTIATIDRDFDVYRIEGKRPFTILIK